MDKQYLDFTIYQPQEAPTEAEIDEIEKLLGAKIPDDFLDFLNHANGGSMNYCIEVREVKDTLSFCSIFSSKKLKNYGHPYETFIYEILQSRKNLKTPKEVLPFAVDGGGSILFLDLTEEGNGRVVAFIHGLPEWTGSESNDTFMILATSFKDYLGKLFECDDFA